MSKNAGKIKLSGKKLCKLASKGDIEQAAEHARKAKFICKKCLRVGASKKNLCKAQEL